MSSLLIKIAGIDLKQISLSPKIEQRCATAMGTLIVLITSLAFVSAGFALWLIFFPTGFYLRLHSIGLMSGLVVFLFFWSWCIFNFFRFIVSSFSSYGHEFSRKDYPKFFLQIAFGIVLGTAVSLPVSVALSFKDMRSELLPDQILYIMDVKKDIDKKYENDLNLLYGNYVDVNREYELVKSNYVNISQLSYLDSPEVVDAISKIKQLVENSKLIDQKIKELRAQIRAETEEVELEITSHHSLIDAIGKALFFNAPLVFLVWIFINVLVAFPVIQVMFHFAGVYETLVACENTIFLANHGIVANATSIFVNEEKIDIPYYATAANIAAIVQHELRKNLEYKSKLIKDNFNKRLTSFRSITGQAKNEK